MVATTGSEPIGEASTQDDGDTKVNAVASPFHTDDEKRVATKDRDKITNLEHIVYNPKKPKWWNRLGNNGRDATKSQKRAMRKVLDGQGGTTKSIDSSSTLGLRLPPIPYGSKLDWDEIFPNSSEDRRDIWLELGFGRGENLQALLESKLWKEKRREETNRFYLIGAEVSGVGIGCLCKRIEGLFQEKDEEICEDHYSLYHPKRDPFSPSDMDDSVDTVASERIDKTNGKDATIDAKIPWIKERRNLATEYSGRLRIHTGDGYKLLPKLPDGSLSAILVTFPDPFPKETDVNYRLVQHQTLIECHRILRKGNGRLFLATDHDGYHDWCHKIMDEVNKNNQDMTSPVLLFEIEEPCPNRTEWLPAVSRYEQKGWDEGRSTKLTCWVAI